MTAFSTSERFWAAQAVATRRKPRDRHMVAKAVSAVHNLIRKRRNLFRRQQLLIGGHAIGKSMMRQARDEHIVALCIQQLSKRQELMRGFRIAVQQDNDLVRLLAMRQEHRPADRRQLARRRRIQPFDTLQRLGIRLRRMARLRKIAHIQRLQPEKEDRQQ
jgi:hypothetical protein